MVFHFIFLSLLWNDLFSCFHLQCFMTLIYHPFEHLSALNNLTFCFVFIFYEPQTLYGVWGVQRMFVLFQNLSGLRNIVRGNQLLNIEKNKRIYFILQRNLWLSQSHLVTRKSSNQNRLNSPVNCPNQIILSSGWRMANHCRRTPGKFNACQPLGFKQFKIQTI